MTGDSCHTPRQLALNRCAGSRTPLPVWPHRDPRIGDSSPIRVRFCATLRSRPLLWPARIFSSLTSLIAALVIGRFTADSATCQWVRLAPNDSVRVTVQGDGPPIVLIAGPIGGAWGFRRVTSALVQSGYRVFAIDPFDPTA